jgi:5-methylcytosine-specific restriction endonuclease McrA
LQNVRLTLAALVEIEALRREGEANREGTLYRVLLPEEIPVCIKRRQERALQTATIPAIEAEADFYNVRENRIEIYERDDYKCGHCGKQLTRFTATLDHVQPVAEGGDNSASNLLTSCLQYNSRKTSRPLGDFMADTNPTA